SPGGRSARGKESGRPLWQRPAAAIAPSRLGAALRAGGGAGASLLVLVLVAAADHASQQGRCHHQQREDLLHRIPTFPGGVNGNTENRNAPPTIDGENKACVGLLLLDRDLDFAARVLAAAGDLHRGLGVLGLLGVVLGLEFEVARVLALRDL